MYFHRQTRMYVAMKMMSPILKTIAMSNYLNSSTICES